MRPPAAKQSHEQLAEMRVELIECADETFAPFLVKRGDTAAEPCDRLGQFGALVPQAFDPFADLLRFAFGDEVDRTDRLALAGEAFQSRVERGWVGRRLVVRLGELAQRLRRRVQ